jgi:membrane-associated phospholipid phosphatase
MPLVAPNVLSRSFRSKVLPSEWAVILYCLALILVCMVFRSRIPRAEGYAAGHAAILLLTAAMTGAKSGVLRFFRDFDLCVYVPALFLMVCALVHRVHPVDYDDRLLAADRAIGGVAVLRWMASIETPLLTVLAKAAWIGYYGIALIPAVAFYRRTRKQDFEEAKVVFLLGWLLTYVCYFLVPAQGPGYCAKEVGVAQPVFDAATSKVREWIYALEGDARDTFPSGHVVIAVLVIYLCLRNRAWGAAALGIPVSLAVILSTLYLRYHYLVDVLGGIVLAAGCAAAGTAWYRRHDEAKIGDAA